MSRAQQIFSIRRRLAFLRELERRLKEKAAVLDAYKPARRSPSLAVCSSNHASSASGFVSASSSSLTLSPARCLSGHWRKVADVPIYHPEECDAGLAA